MFVHLSCISHAFSLHFQCIFMHFPTHVDAPRAFHMLSHAFSLHFYAIVHACSCTFVHFACIFLKFNAFLYTFPCMFLNFLCFSHAFHMHVSCISMTFSMHVHGLLLHFHACSMHFRVFPCMFMHFCAFRMHLSCIFDARSCCAINCDTVLLTTATRNSTTLGLTAEQELGCPFSHAHPENGATLRPRTWQTTFPYRNYFLGQWRTTCCLPFKATSFLLH